MPGEKSKISVSPKYLRGVVSKGFKKCGKIKDLRTSFVMNSDASNTECNNFREFELFD